MRCICNTRMGASSGPEALSVTDAAGGGVMRGVGAAVMASVWALVWALAWALAWAWCGYLARAGPKMRRMWSSSARSRCS